MSSVGSDIQVCTFVHGIAEHSGVCQQSSAGCFLSAVWAKILEQNDAQHRRCWRVVARVSVLIL